MHIETLSSRAKAFVRPAEGANIGLVHTDEGYVLIDTPTFPPDMRNLLNAAEITASDVRLVINTHYHADHTWSNQVFDCPILAHRLCRETMETKLKNEWSLAGIEEMLREYEKEDPGGGAETRAKLDNLTVRLPTEVIDERKAMQWEGVRLELIHVGGHTPGSVIVWLPNEKTLFASDLLFIGRYPYIDEANIPDLIEALKKLPDFGAKTIVPGHGPLCGSDEIIQLRNYLEGTWEWTKTQLRAGRSAEKCASDANSPQYVDKDEPPGRREQNIRVMAEQIKKGSST
jgi:cyclase